MNAALRQATYVGPPPTARREERTDPHIVMPVPLTQAAPVPLTQAAPVPLTQNGPPPAPSAPRKQPLKLSGDAQAEANLWGSAPAANRAAPAPGVQSFEEALRRVDSTLKNLVGPNQPRGPEPLVEPIVEAEVAAPRVEEVGSPDEEGKLRRQRLLRRAMENLGALPAQSSNSGTYTGPSPSSPVPPPRPVPSGADQQLAAQIEARFAQLTRKDHFLTLGLPPSATKEQVKASFLNLAKIFHPDRLPPSLPHLAQKMSSVFEGIRDAYETLYDEGKRAGWIASRQASPAGSGNTGSNPAFQPGGQPTAADLLKQAEVFFKKRDYRHAEESYGKAFALDKNANTLAAQAWCIYMDPTRKPEGQAARQMMQKALAMDPTSDRTHYQVGVIARVEGDMDRAERHFREAVKANPRHLEANQEIRLIEMRKKKAAAPPTNKGGGGFFG